MKTSPFLLFALTLSCLASAAAQNLSAPGRRFLISPVIPPVLPEVPTVSIEATVPDATALAGAKGVFTVRRTLTDEVNGLAALAINYRVGGTAVGGTQYRVLPGTVTIPAGETEVRVKVKPLPAGSDGATQAMVKLTITAGEGYQIGSPDKAKVRILPGTPVP